MTAAQQPELPYLGWTLPQFEFWTRRALRHAHRTRADYIESTVVSVQAVLTREARHLMTNLVAELRSSDGQRAENLNPAFAPGPAD